MIAFGFFCAAGILYFWSSNSDTDFMYDWKWAIQGFALIFAISGAMGALGLVSADSCSSWGTHGSCADC
jgi:hypothetical protein